MKGLELSRRYFDEYGKKMLEEQFNELLPYISVGVFGSGSECYGFDDEISQDHDYEAGFIIILPGEDIVDRKSAFQLERAYAKLPKSFMGVERGKLSPVGGNRRGVIRAEDFFLEKVGKKDGLLEGDEWFAVPENYLAEVTNGEIFMDTGGVFTSTREYLSTYPKDVKLKKLAGNLLLAKQAGQYNYKRCLLHGETGAAQLAVCEFVKAAMQTVFLLNDRYQPYYKWAFRAYGELIKLSDLKSAFEFLLTTDNAEEDAKTKYAVIEDICAAIAGELKEQSITKATCTDLEKHAYSVNDFISDPVIRNRHILYAVK